MSNEMGKSYWQTEGDNIETDEIDNICFNNDSVNEFRKFINKNFIIATKGIGKTTLLKAKRYDLEQNYYNKRKDNQDVPKIIFVPENNPYLDSLQNIGSLDNETQTYLSDSENAAKVWILALQVSISNYFIRLQKKRINEMKEEYEKHHSKLAELFFFEEQITPCSALSHIIQKFKRGEIEREYDRMKTFAGRIFNRYVQSGVYVFIDRIDQAIDDEKYDLRLWISMQAGLLQASWNLMRNNNHVKIYTSIRLEAFHNYESTNKLALTGSITFLKYDKDDLLSLMDNLSNYYSNKDDSDEPTKKMDFYQYIGFRDFIHPVIGKQDAFRYILRHTICRPRDLVAMASNYKKSKYKDEQSKSDNFRKSINETATKFIAISLFEEYAIFLDSLNDDDNRRRFLSSIDKNILSFKEIKEICRKFNNESDCEKKTCEDCEHPHPFCELNNIGLIGVIDEKTQNFLQPHEMRKFSRGHLRTSDYYFIHPCLNKLIKEERKNKFKQIKGISVGQDEKWETWYSGYMDLLSILDEITDEKTREEINFLISSHLKKDDTFADTKLTNIEQIKEKISPFIKGAIDITTLIKNITSIFS